jgi:hypothetical protein
LKVSKPEVSGSAIHQGKHKQKVVVRGWIIILRGTKAKVLNWKEGEKKENF